MRNVGLMLFSFYVLTACVLVAMTRYDVPLANRIFDDREDQRAALQSYCEEWPSDAECLVSSLPTQKD